MRIPTETERAHIYTQLANALDVRSAEFLMGLLPSDQDDRLATRKDLQILSGVFTAELTEKIGDAETRLNSKIGDAETRLNDKIDQVEARLNDKIDQVEARLSDKIDALGTRLTALLIAVLLAVMGAMAAVYFAPDRPAPHEPPILEQTE